MVELNGTENAKAKAKEANEKGRKSISKTVTPQRK